MHCKSNLTSIQVIGIDVANMHPIRCVHQGRLVAFVGLTVNSANPRAIYITPVDYEDDLSFLGEGSYDLVRISFGRGSVRNWPELYDKVFK